MGPSPPTCPAAACCLPGSPEEVVMGSRPGNLGRAAVAPAGRVPRRPGAGAKPPVALPCWSGLPCPDWGCGTQRPQGPLTAPSASPSRNLEQEISFDFGPHGEFAYLYSQCYELTTNEWAARPPHPWAGGAVRLGGPATQRGGSAGVQDTDGAGPGMVMESGVPVSVCPPRLGIGGPGAPCPPPTSPVP